MALGINSGSGRTNYAIFAIVAIVEKAETLDDAIIEVSDLRDVIVGSTTMTADHQSDAIAVANEVIEHLRAYEGGAR